MNSRQLVRHRSAAKRAAPLAAPCWAALFAALLTACAPSLPPGVSPAATCEAPAAAMVDLGSLDAGIATEIRYATRNNFTGAPLPGYEAPRALLRPQAAESLLRVQERLRANGYGLKIWDAYRPVRATLAMVEWAERTGNEWVLDQGYVARRSGHNRGATVDLTVIRRDTGAELDMGTAYDEFSEAAHTANAAGAVRENRDVLRQAMEAEGWQNYEREWWHWTYPGEFEPMDVPLHCF